VRSRLVALLVIVAWARAAYARDQSLELELRLSRSSFGMRADTMSGRGTHDDFGERSVTVSPRDEGYRRPTFTVLGIAFGMSERYVAIFGTISGGTGSADAAPTAGYQPALHAGSSRLFAVAIEPQLRAPIGSVTFALGLHTGYGWISAPLRDLRGRNARATGSQVLLTPRAVVTWDAFHLFSQSSAPTTITLSAFAGFDVLYRGPGAPPIEAGIAVGSATPFGSRTQ
jgi:hypothetical protein